MNGRRRPLKLRRQSRVCVPRDAALITDVRGTAPDDRGGMETPMEYIHTDIPAGMSCGEFRRQNARAKPRRLRSFLQAVAAAAVAPSR
jgi:hypothetical protein